MSLRLPTIAIALTLAAFTFSARAEDQAPPSEKTELAGQLIELFQVEKNMNAIIDRMMKTQQQMLDGADLNAEEKAKRQKAMKVAMDETKAAMSWDKIEPIFVSLYADTFDTDDLKAMIAFYKSPAGQKWVAKQPELQAATMQKVQELIIAAQPKIQAAVKKAMEADEAKKGEEEKK